jgi:hypothetical protein
VVAGLLVARVPALAPGPVLAPVLPPVLPLFAAVLAMIGAAFLPPVAAVIAPRLRRSDAAEPEGARERGAKNG